ncbi:MlaD family protein [Niabella beijingensis]|uniref:MlaD family protein n=1 Tax=Niabella beijingensis TaxID=2872700 RepID=UPI001CBD9D09|nr:MlaD family protein [Niabella beijingensis]MBZ4190279.1 MlaD family protein [Niabella beijingensis]
MKISNELKVGVLAVIAITALIFGFRFLKGKDIFNHNPKIYAIFRSVGGLEKSNFVKINGLAIGSVYKIEPADANVSAIRVTLSITEDVNIPANSVAYISGSLLGASEVVIDKGNSKEYLGDEAEIKTRVEEGLLGDLSSEAKPLMGKVRTVADSLTLLLSHFNNTLDVPTQRNLQEAIAHLKNTVGSLNLLLSSVQKPLAASLDNMSVFTESLKRNNGQVDQILGNVNALTGNLSKLQLEQTLDTLSTTVVALRDAVNKISSPEGSIGALMNDRQLYNRLNGVALSAEILLDDIRVHPKRYVNISVFGKKNKAGELTAPAIKDTVPR